MKAGLLKLLGFITCLCLLVAFPLNTAYANGEEETEPPPPPPKIYRYRLYKQVAIHSSGSVTYVDEYLKSRCLPEGALEDIDAFYNDGSTNMYGQILIHFWSRTTPLGKAMYYIEKYKTFGGLDWYHWNFEKEYGPFDTAESCILLSILHQDEDIAERNATGICKSIGTAVEQVGDVMRNFDNESGLCRIYPAEIMEELCPEKTWASHPDDTDRRIVYGPVENEDTCIAYGAGETYLGKFDRYQWEFPFYTWGGWGFDE